MENQQYSEVSNPLDNFFNISFDAQTRAQIKLAALWARICSLCAFIGYGVSLVVVIFGHPDYSMEAEGFSVGAYIRSGKSIWTVLISAAIGTLINYFLYRFATATAQGMNSLDNIKTNEGFNSLRVYFKIYGIALIIALSLAALALLIYLIAFGLGRN